MRNLQISSTAPPASSILGRADADLLRRVVPGSPESLGRFYDAYAPRLFLFVSRAFPGDAAAADAAMEEVFWCVWKESATRPDGIAEMDLWLRKIVGACCRAIRTKSLPSAVPGRGPRLVPTT
jgi:DNA-directed RNA polymerase specialized sigma24 family protein